MRAVVGLIDRRIRSTGAHRRPVINMAAIRFLGQLVEWHRRDQFDLLDLGGASDIKL